MNGLTYKEIVRFEEFLIKANDIQLELMIKSANQEIEKRFKNRHILITK